MTQRKRARIKPGQIRPETGPSIPPTSGSEAEVMERVTKMAENSDAHKDNSAKLEAVMEARSRLARWLSAGVAIMTIVVAVASLFAGLESGLMKPFASKPGLDIQLLRDVAELKTRINETKNSLAEVSNTVAALSQPDTTTDSLKQIAAMKEDVARLSERIKAIDAAIVENPTKALSVPLLRQDLENLKGNYQSDREKSTKEIDRIYDQNKWFIGLMFTMALGIIGLAVSNFIQAKKPKATE